MVLICISLIISNIEHFFHVPVCFVIFAENFVFCFVLFCFLYGNVVTLEIRFCSLPRDYCCFLMKAAVTYLFSDLFFLFVCFLGLNPQHIEVHRPGVQSELQLLACATATATLWDLSRTCDLHHSSQQCWIL